MMNYRQNPFEDVRRFFKGQSILKKLIIINVAVFLFIAILQTIVLLFQVPSDTGFVTERSIFTEYLGIPANISTLLMRPWTIFTYMFVQQEFMHILSNMIVLYFGGRIFTEYMSEKKLLKVYIYGGLAGALFFVSAFNVFPWFSRSVEVAVAIGSSASVLAILIAATTYVPNYSILRIPNINIKLWHLAVFYVVFDLISVAGDNAGGHIAHLGGAFWGYFYVRMFHANKQMHINTGNMNFRRFFKFFYKKKEEPVYRSSFDKGRPMTDDEYNFRKNIDQEKIDTILEKISRSGYSSLSREEKEMLFQSSKKQN
ncbi:MAG: rhomboid family intramembrane serine protease [Bacteroidales bacterium]|nr:rhomboid family intramembrane serine protease [Bacteroidales bacterium]